jgi:hypothetical protein
LGHSRPSHFVPVLNNVRYASDSDHSRYESELTLWAKRRHMQCSKTLLDSMAQLAGLPSRLHPARHAPFDQEPCEMDHK